MCSLSILVFGSTERSEFRDPLASLDSLGRVTVTTDVRSAVAAITGGVVGPDVIVVAQAYPGQFSSDAIDRLRQVAPLARVVALLGSWCEGEMRTGKPWPGAIRLYWHQWQPQCERELRRLAAGGSSTWALPMTSGDEERLLAASHDRVPDGRGRVALCTPRFDMQQWLLGACQHGGYTTCWVQPHRWAALGEVSAAVFDADECSGDEVDSLERLVAEVDPAPVVALLDFPRIESRNRALGAGARAVLSKPLLVEDLLWQIDRLLENA